MSVACAPRGEAAQSDDGPSGFVAADDNSRWLLQGEVTTSTAPGILLASAALPLPTTGVVDCDRVRIVDSTAVAVLLALKRRARSEQQPITFSNVPAPLMALASVYGVADLLVG